MLQMVKTNCNDLGTMPRLTALILQALCEWSAPGQDENSNQLNSSEKFAALRRLVLQQNAIGWDHLFLGRFSSEWSSLQDEYYARRSHSTET